MVEGDYWLYTLPVKRGSEAGTAVEFGRHDGRQANSPKYYRGVSRRRFWKSVEEDLLTAPEDPSIRYTCEVLGHSHGSGYQHASVMQTVRFADPVEGAVQIRCRAVDVTPAREVRRTSRRAVRRPTAAVRFPPCPEPRHGDPGRHEEGALPRQLVPSYYSNRRGAQRDRLERGTLPSMSKALKGSQNFRQHLSCRSRPTPSTSEATITPSFQDQSQNPRPTGATAQRR